MKRELRKLRAKGGEYRSLANYISALQHKGKINTYITEKGYVCYDTDELKEYRATVHKGRPYKAGAIKIGEDK